MKRSEYKKLLLEFMRLDKTVLITENLNDANLNDARLFEGEEFNYYFSHQGEKYFVTNYENVYTESGNWACTYWRHDRKHVIDNDFPLDSTGKITKHGYNPKTTKWDDSFPVIETLSNDINNIVMKTPSGTTIDITPYAVFKEAELKNSGYKYFGYVTIKSTSYIVWNKQDDKQLILADEDAEKKYFFKDNSINNTSPNIDSQLSNVTLTRDASGKPKSFDYEESDKIFSATIDTGTTTFAAATTTAKKKTLSSSAETSIKEIQKIIKAPSSDDGTKPGDGKWGKKTQAAFVKYLSANSEALKEKEIDDPGKFASDATYMKEKLGELNYPKNVKGVLTLLESLETEESGTTSSAASKDDKDYLISPDFRSKYYKDENDTYYYVDVDGKYVYKDTFEYESFGAEPFASFSSKDKISVQGKEVGTTVKVSKWGTTVDKIHYKEWTEITENAAKELEEKNKEPAVEKETQAPSPSSPKAEKTRRENRKDRRQNRRKDRLNKRLNKLQETNMNEKLINEMKKGKASLLNLLNEQVPELMDKPEGGGSSPTKQPKKKSWDYYVSVGKNDSDKKQRSTLSNLWKNISGETKYSKDSIEVLNYDESIYPGNFGSDLSDFSAWYKKVLPLEIKNGKGEVVKEKGDNFNVEKANEIILLLLADAGATPEVISGFRIPSETLAIFKDAAEHVKSGQGSTKSAAQKEKIEESLSRGALYRRRYHGRY